MKMIEVKAMVAILLLAIEMTFAQSNVTVSVPPGAVITIPAAPSTNAPVSIVPPPRSQASDENIAAMVLAQRHSRIIAMQLAALHSQRFEVVQVEVSASVRADRDARGVLTGTFSPETNWIAVIAPVRGTNEPIVRGANQAGTGEWVFLFPVEVGNQIDINLRRNL